MNEADHPFDFISLGALVHRLDPGIIPFRKASDFKIHISGGEYNVAANLADCFGLNTGFVSAIVEYPLGDMIAERVRSMGVRSFFKKFTHNGVNGPNMAAVYSDRGFGIRPPVVFYNRANEAAALLKKGDFNWDEIFAPGIKWFHSGGIFASLSESAGELIIEAMQEAKSRGAVTSFDLNFRPKLWNILSEKDKFSDTLKKIVRHTDILLGIQNGLDIPEPDATESPLNPEIFFDMIENLVKEFPNIKASATTLRHERSANRHLWSAAAWVEGKTYTAPAQEIEIFDRVGSGDGFASGFFYGLLNNYPPEEALKIGWAHGALLMTYPGDTTMATLKEVMDFASGTSARIQR